jgi:hypothetical protein
MLALLWDPMVEKTEFQAKVEVASADICISVKVAQTNVGRFKKSLLIGSCELRVSYLCTSIEFEVFETSLNWRLGERPNIQSVIPRQDMQSPVSVQ